MAAAGDVRAARSPLRIVLPALALGMLAAVLAIYFQRGFVPGDSFTYLAGGERLNAGHPLYALSPGDRLVELHPPYWTVPLLSPPFMAVVLRPFALLGDLGAYLWWACCLGAIGITLAGLVRRRPALTSIALLVLVFPLAYEIGVGNVNGILLAAAVAIWLLVRAGRSAAAGPVAVAMVALKLTPLPVAAWVAGAGGRRGVTGLAVGLLIVGAVSLVGAGLAAHLDYLGVMRATTGAGLSPASLGGLARSLGVPDPIPSALPTAILLGGTIASYVLAATGRPGLGFGVAVVAWTFGTPVVNINTPSVLLAALAPVAWPWGEGRVNAQRVAPESDGMPAPVRAPQADRMPAPVSAPQADDQSIDGVEPAA